METNATAIECSQNDLIKSQLLDAMTRAKTQFVQRRDTRTVLDGLLAALLDLAESEYGFIGLMTLHMPNGDNDHDVRGHAARNRSILSGIADRLAPVLSGIELRMRLHEDSIRDPLTRLYNRRSLDESLRRELSRARRAECPLSIIMLDLDKFKHVNDEYGHDIGVQVLMMLARQLSHVVRDEDIVYRYGGEEFAIIMPGANLEVAKERALDVRRAVKAMRIQTDKGPLHITLSAGVATYPEHGNTEEQLIVQADRALYVAKQSGRDRVRLASQKNISALR